MTRPGERQPSDEELRRIASGATVESEVMAWLKTHDPDGHLLEKARTEIGLNTGSTESDSTEASTDCRRPTIAEMHHIAEGRTVDPAVLKWLEEEDDGGVRAEIEQLKADDDLLGELAAVHREKVPAGSSMLDAPTPPGYDIIREIDRGAQGAVFLATQVAAKRQVALKVLLQGSFATDRQRMRFEREVEVVASLKHPNIVTLFDSGLTSDGSAYLAMEFVDGVPLNEYQADSGTHPSRPSDIRAQADLFIRICDAVSYAHQKGIIHRDLKPANILVDKEGQPHILDFGLAKAVEESPITESRYEMTAAGEFMGTFAYASPEQVSGNPDLVDTRTDVYALGVILYEMLLEQRPYRVTGSIAQMVKSIVDEPPVSPRQLDPAISQDIETILLRSLDKETDRRYQSPAAIASDLRHWLRGEAIEARRDDSWYVARKFLRRHWLPVSGVAAALIVLTGFAVFMTILWERADHFNRTSDRMLVSATQLLGNMDRENPDQPMSAASMAELMERWSGIINDNLAEFPELSARLNTSLGSNFISIGEFDDASAALNESLDALAQAGLSDSPDAALIHHELGRLHWRQKQLEESRRHYATALAIRRSQLGDDDPDTLKTSRHHAVVLMDMGLADQATRELERTAEVLEDAIPKAASGDRRMLIANLADARNTMAVLLIEGARPVEGIAMMQQAIELLSQISDNPDQDWRIGNILNTLAEAKLSIGDMAGAEADLLQAMKIKQRGGSPRLIANGQAMMARLRLQQDRFAESLEMATSAYRERIARLQPSSHAVTSLKEIMAESLMGLERTEEAEQAIEELQRIYGTDAHEMDLLGMRRLQAMLRFHEGDVGLARQELQLVWSTIESLGTTRTPLGQAVRRNLDMVNEQMDRVRNDSDTRR
ncbi:MAG: hypothetical protein CMJ40_11245 [Phycisphaerae bacterium]|nr:hypothetical protein [Phycisphaerae bacterium]